MNMDSGVFLESECMLSPLKNLRMRKMNSKLAPVATCLSVNLHDENSHI